MWQIVRNFGIVFAVVLLVIIPFAIGTAHSEEKCNIEIGAGGVGILVCGGEAVEQLPLPTVKVTVPGPTVTDIIKIPGPTVTVPGPTKTVTQPGPTTTITAVVTEATQGPTETKTIVGPTETAIKNQTVTASPTASVPNVTGSKDVDDDTSDGVFSTLPGGVVKAGIGILSTIIILGSLLLALYAGYVLGYKDSERESADFMNAISDKIRLRHNK